MEMLSEEAAKYVWEGAIPIQVHLHESDVTTLPPPTPAMALAPRIGYLQLLVPQIKPHFDSALPPGIDTVWFDYKGVPLKWYIPTGVLFDLLCAEPERPWNLTVHFRGYPADTLTPCAGEEAVKWSFINAMKEAAYIINGNCKSIMNMSQADQYDLWQSLLNGSLENHCRVVSKLKLGTLMEDCKTRTVYRSQQVTSEPSNSLPNQTGRIPVRLYIRHEEEAEDLNSWDKVSFLSRPVENRVEDDFFTLRKAMQSLLPELLYPPHESKADSTVEGSPPSVLEEGNGSDQRSRVSNLRIQGITPSWDTPFAWIANNLAHPDLFVHICLFISRS